MLANGNSVASSRNHPVYSEARSNPYEFELSSARAGENPYSALGQTDNCQGQHGYERSMQRTQRTADDNLYTNTCLKT